MTQAKVQKKIGTKTADPKPQELKKAEADKAAQDLLDDTDALLDEIDAVLEENAAEFVAAYVQKGGE